MKQRLIRPEELVAREDDSRSDMQDRLLKLQATAKVLEQSIMAQTEVARQMESIPEHYEIALRVVEGIRDGYGETRLEAAVLDLKLLLGGDLQVASFLERMANEIRAQQANAHLFKGSMPPMADGGAVGSGLPRPDEPSESGTSVAGEQETETIPEDGKVPTIG